MYPAPSEWRFAPLDPAAEAALVAALGVAPLVAKVLVCRGLSDPTEAERFLRADLGQLHDPALLPDFRAAADAILGAVERKERIYIHGDYDADGVTSTALFTRFLRAVGADVVPHVPHRIKEGYGIHLDAVREAAETGAKLFLTCDCGVAAPVQVQAAREQGMQVVVTDHHHVPERLPDAQALVNPHRPESQYPFPELSGVGIVLKLCAGLAQEMGLPLDKYYRAYLDLAAIGTVADVVPLIGENRVIARHGIAALASTQKLGLQALLMEARLWEERNTLDAFKISHQIAPRLNAAGRIDDAALALQLLITRDETEARSLAAELERLNSERRAEQARCVDEALAALGPIDELGLVNIVTSDTWHPGLIGLVAGRLVEATYRPTWVITFDEDGVGKASARSVRGFHAALAQAATAAHHEGGGGHEMAAGLRIRRDQVEAFRAAMEAHAAATLTPEMQVRLFHIDAEVDAVIASAEATYQLRQLEPFGEANPAPRFAGLGLTLMRVKPMRNPEHVTLDLVDASGTPVSAVAFGIGLELAAMGSGARFDAIFKPEINRYQGRETFRWNLSQVRAS